MRETYDILPQAISSYTSLKKLTSTIPDKIIMKIEKSASSLEKMEQKLGIRNSEQDNKRVSDQRSNLNFRFPQCFDHKTIILREEKDTATLPWRRKLSEGIISTY